jgi:tRNA pseudouridine65 synthase
MQSLDASAHLFRMDVLFRDDALMVVNKPSGVPVHKGWAADPVDCVKLARRIAKRRVNPVHRLDRPTSGCLLFAYDGETTGLLQDLFKEHAIDKCYLALVRGVTPEGGVIDHPIPRKLDGPKVDAVTEYTRLAVVEDRFSLVEARPASGRLHQIRRHFKHLSHPLVGDTRYGKGEINRRFRSEFGLLRLGLHAFRLAFPHPRTGEPLHITAPLPDDLRVPLERMGFDTPSRFVC